MQTGRTGSGCRNGVPARSGSGKADGRKTGGTDRRKRSEGQHARPVRKGPCLPRGSTSEGEAARPDRRERRRKDGTRKHARSGRKRGNAGTAARAPATARPMWSGTADAAGLKAEQEGSACPAGRTGRLSGLEEYRPRGWEPKGRERRKDAVSSGAGMPECQQRRQWGPAAMPALICVRSSRFAPRRPAAPPPGRKVDRVDTVQSKNCQPPRSPSAATGKGRKAAELLGIAGHTAVMPQSGGCRTAHYE